MPRHATGSRLTSAGAPALPPPRHEEQARRHPGDRWDTASRGASHRYAHRDAHAAQG
ncbi:hypothetical protein ACFYPT_07100 [Streptomyces sp. NPDC005529]|uniref:hypothetical protein n=1 Tax=unclassified Streptomyces TaxID=2593676 RepID=UPI0033B2671C